MLNTELIDIILDYKESGSLYKIQQLAQELKNKIEACKNNVEYAMTLGVDNQISQTGFTKDNQITNESLPEDNTFECPMSLRVCMFQFSESNNLERITNILQNLCTYSRDVLFKLIQKYELDVKLIKVMQKYCNGEYGFDLNVSKQGLFQINYLKSIAISFDLCNPQLEANKNSQFQIKSGFEKSLASLSLIEKLASTGFYELYSQLIEEALIFTYDYTFKVEMPKNCKIYDFLNSSLCLFEALLAPKFIPFMKVILDLLEKIRERLQKVFIKGEKSCESKQSTDGLIEFLKKNFQENKANESDSEDITEDCIGPFQKNLDNYCPELSEFSKCLSNLILKFETILEYSDSINAYYTSEVPMQSKSREDITKYGTGEYNRCLPDSSYEPKDNLIDRQPRGVQDYSIRGSQASNENDIPSKYYDKNRYLKSAEKENSKITNEAGLYLSKDYAKQENTNDRIYLSDKYYKDRSLEFSGNNKLRTSVKERPGKDLGNINKIDKDSLGSPISYQSEQDQPNIYEEAINYYQARETKGRNTFERHPYE